MCFVYWLRFPEMTEKHAQRSAVTGITARAAKRAARELPCARSSWPPRNAKDDVAVGR
jgi:hypothetical protein